MFPFEYCEYKANEEKKAQEEKAQEEKAQAPDPFEKSKALGVGSLMSATPDELNKEFILPHASRHKNRIIKRKMKHMTDMYEAIFCPEIPGIF